MSAERVVPDTAATAAPPAPIVRFAASDLPEWGPWLIARLTERCPGFSEAAWLSKIRGLMGSNDFLFIRNDRAVLLASAEPRILDGSTMVTEVFAFSRDAQKEGDHPIRVPPNSDAEETLAILYRHTRAWAISKKASRMFVGQCTDIWQARFKEVIDSGNCGWIAVKL